VLIREKALLSLIKEDGGPAWSGNVSAGDAAVRQKRAGKHKVKGEEVHGAHSAPLGGPRSEKQSVPAQGGHLAAADCRRYNVDLFLP
jgi:hypothetical protein